MQDRIEEILKSSIWFHKDSAAYILAQEVKRLKGEQEYINVQVRLAGYAVEDNMSGVAALVREVLELRNDQKI